MCTRGTCDKYRFLPFTILMPRGPRISIVKSSAGTISGVENFTKTGVVDRLTPAEGWWTQQDRDLLDSALQEVTGNHGRGNFGGGSVGVDARLQWAED